MPATSTSPEIQPKAISVMEAGKLLGISKNHAYAAVHAGTIPTVRIGKRLIVPVEALNRMLNGEAVATDAA